MSANAAVIDFATREPIPTYEDDPGRDEPADDQGDVASSLDAARRLLQPRTRVSALLGLTSKDLDRAVARVRADAWFMPAAAVLKRTFDVAFSIALLIALAPLLLVIAIMVRLDSPGPVLFRQLRVGLNGTEFQMLKFRTMYVDGDERLAMWIVHQNDAGIRFDVIGDPRITKIGQFLRKYSLDELPQFLNVMRGHMSMVGPRPPLPVEVRASDPTMLRRFNLRPGVTGLWQISDRSSLTWEESLRLNLYYVENWSVGVDLAILWRTVRAIF